MDLLVSQVGQWRWYSVSPRKYTVQFNKDRGSEACNGKSASSPNKDSRVEACNRKSTSRPGGCIKRKIDRKSTSNMVVFLLNCRISPSCITSVVVELSKRQLQMLAAVAAVAAHGK